MKRTLSIALTVCVLAGCGSDEDPTDYLTVRAEVNKLGGQCGVNVVQPGHTTVIKHAQLESNAVITIPTARSGNMTLGTPPSRS